MTPEALFEGIARGHFHEGGLRIARLGDESTLPGGVGFGWLRDEVVALVAAETASDVRDPAHVSNWAKPVGEPRQLSLLNRTGRFDDYRHDHNGRAATRDAKSFHHGDRYPVIAALIAALPEAINMRLGIQPAGAGLQPHEEPSTFTAPDGDVIYRVRTHVPVVTNPDAVVMCDGDLYHLAAGQRYYFNNGCVHAARNEHPDETRIHLLWDQWLTADVYRTQFTECTPLDPVGVEAVGDYPRRGKNHTLTWEEWHRRRSRFAVGDRR